MTEQQIKIIKALADCNMNVQQTAKSINYHRNTIIYHLQKIKNETGLNPMNFYDLVKLINLEKQEMTKQTETYYLAEDGTRFKTEETCREYETEKERYKMALKKKREAEKEIAVIEYARFRREGGYVVQSTTGSFGCDHDGYYTKCPHCGELTGNYEGKNLGLKVDEGIYKCEKCGGFFCYS